jgi:hypothetical protein
MPYAKRWTGGISAKQSELVLDNNVHIVPALASLQSMVGQAIAGAIIDEINFMSIVEDSKQVAGNYGMGGRYRSSRHRLFQHHPSSRAFVHHPWRHPSAASALRRRPATRATTSTRRWKKPSNSNKPNGRPDAALRSTTLHR